MDKSKVAHFLAYPVHIINIIKYQNIINVQTI